MGDTNLDSSGVGLDSSYTFQLGSFGQSTGGSFVEFTPNQENLDQWADHWIPHDTAAYSQAPVPFDSTGFFSDTWTIGDNSYEGFQAYIWVYNNHNGDETSEWVLITDLEGVDAWQIPVSADSQQDFPNSWRVSTATDVLYGGLNSTNGPGEFDPNAPLTFALRTSGFAPTPEPGPVALLGATLAVFLLGRRRVRQ